MSTTAERLDPTATLTPTQALAHAARLNRLAVEMWEDGAFDAAGQTAQLALSLTAYATATGKWQGR